MIMDIYSLVECILGGVLFLWGLAAVCNVLTFQNAVNILFKKDELSSFLTHLFALMILPLGLAIVFTHNDWVLDFPIIVTVIGWVWTVKATLWLIIPRLMKKAFLPVVPYILNTWFIRIYGTVLMAIGLFIFYPYIISS